MTPNSRQLAALRLVRSTGAAGLTLGDGIAPGDAVIMRTAGLVEISGGDVRRVRITARGASYLRRDAA